MGRLTLATRLQTFGPICSTEGAGDQSLVRYDGGSRETVVVVLGHERD